MAKFRYCKATDSVVEVTQSAPRSEADWKPLHCEAMAFDGKIEDAKAIDRSLGAPDVPYDANGCPVFDSKSKYNQYLRAHGMVNRTSGKGHHALTAGELERAIKRAREA